MSVPPPLLESGARKGSARRVPGGKLVGGNDEIAKADNLSGEVGFAQVCLDTGNRIVRDFRLNPAIASR